MRKKKKMRTLNEAYPNGAIGSGIFQDLQSYNVPWRDSDVNASLDIVYYSKSGDKFITSLVNRFIVDDVLPMPNRESIAESVFTVFQTKWTKLYAVMFEQYNPIENYRMSELETSNHSVEHESTDTGTISTDNDGDVTRNGTNSATNSVYGFNSSQSVNSDATSGSDNVTETRDLNETETRNLSGTATETGENERSMTRSGNIGVTTSQQLLQSEIDLWQWNFFNQVFADIDSLLCLSIY